MSDFNQTLAQRELQQKFRLTLKLHWFLPLILFGLLFTSFEKDLDFFMPAMVAVLAIYAGNIGAWLLTRRPLSELNLTYLMTVQFTLDIAMTTLLVQNYSLTDSIFTFLYPLIILTAGVFLSGSLALLLATIASLMYAGTLLLGYYFPESGGYFAKLVGEHQEYNSEDALYFGVAIKMFFFHIVALLAGAVRSVIESTRAELERARLDNETLVTTMPAGLVAVGSDDRIVLINDRAGTLLARFGLRVAPGVSFAEVLPPKMGELLQHAIDSEMTCHNRIICRHGEAEYHCDAQAAPLRRDGINYGGVLIFVDVTAQVELEQQLERSQRMSMIGKLLSSIAFGVRNPVKSALRFAEVLHERQEKSKVHFGEMTMLTGALRRADAALTRIQNLAHSPEYRIEPVNMLNLLGRVRQARGEELQHAKAQWVLEGEPVTVLGDAERLQQLVNHLIDNALAAMPAGGTIRINLSYQLQPESAESWVLMRFSDTGEGIPLEMQSRIFDPFFTTKGDSHYGLGLSVCAKTADDLGGSFLLEESRPGATAFLLILPAAPVPKPAA